MTPLRVLFLPGFTSRSQDYKASDAVGYGITASRARPTWFDAPPGTGLL